MNKSTLSTFFQLLLVAAISFASAPLVAQSSVYKWTDSDGIVHYGATPPLGVEAELVKTSGAGPSRSAGSNVGSDTLDNNSEAEAQPVKLSPEMQARKESLCKDERKRLSTLQKPGRIRIKQPDGSTKYLSIEEVQAEINITQQVIKDTCS